MPDRLELLHRQGVRGGIIPPHRSMAGLRWSAWRLVSTLVLAGGGFALLVVALPWIGDLWQFLFARIRDGLGGLDTPLTAEPLALPGGLSITLPSIQAVTPQPGLRALWIAAGVSVGLFLASLPLPERFTPARYFLRLLATLQLIAVGFFAFSPEPFPYRIQDHVFLLLTAGLVVMALVPLVLGLTLHVFDIALWKKALLTLVVMGHLAVFLPLKAMVHVWLILHGTAVVMPVLFLIFGLLMDVMVFVAFYGWVLSTREEERA
jgi:hypothetical protein